MDKYMKAIEWFEGLAHDELMHGIDDHKVSSWLTERLDGVKVVAMMDRDLTNEEWNAILDKVWWVKYKEERPKND